jgi:hypothetical protein
MAKRNQKILVTHIRLYLWQDTQVAESRGGGSQRADAGTTLFLANEGEKTNERREIVLIQAIKR